MKKKMWISAGLCLLAFCLGISGFMAFRYFSIHSVIQADEEESLNSSTDGFGNEISEEESAEETETDSDTRTALQNKYSQSGDFTLSASPDPVIFSAARDLVLKKAYASIYQNWSTDHNITEDLPVLLYDVDEVSDVSTGNIDLNADGTEELVLFEKDSPRILGVYAFDAFAEQMKLVVSSTESDQQYLYENGVIYRCIESEKRKEDLYYYLDFDQPGYMQLIDGSLVHSGSGFYTSYYIFNEQYPDGIASNGFEVAALEEKYLPETITENKGLLASNPDDGLITKEQWRSEVVLPKMEQSWCSSAAVAQGVLFGIEGISQQELSKLLGISKTKSCTAANLCTVLNKLRFDGRKIYTSTVLSLKNLTEKKTTKAEQSIKDSVSSGKMALIRLNAANLGGEDATVWGLVYGIEENEEGKEMLKLYVPSFQKECLYLEISSDTLIEAMKECGSFSYIS